ncbi:hypothetical protein [Sphingomonas sp. BK345]|uniref:hypothetical protein n=1 Tax=Sphingomonas sp. BK345 TaxID=2586980 RepID=UPI0016133196|nr:hypothetical protein [Sphingomonas sp. BK345]MBB3472780.1 hypothetical protein [Sphingomonas sp. BK345]
MAADELWGPLRFRFFIADDERKTITQPEAIESGWPGVAAEPVDESLLFRGHVAVDQPMPQLRPIFPGTMRFVIDPASLGQATSPIVVDAKGVITEDSLAAFDGILGHIVLWLAPTHLKAAEAAMAIPEIGPAPTAAWYGPVRLTKAFLREALLDPVDGMLANAMPEVDISRKIEPGDVGWQRAVLPAFLAGTYEPTLRAGKAWNGTQDDAERLQMPELCYAPGGATRVELRLALGRCPEGGRMPDTPARPLVEAVPTRLLLQHIASQIVDIVRDPAAESAAAAAVFQGRYDRTAWVSKFGDAVNAIGFGTLSAISHPLSFRLRELQIAAGGAFIAGASPGPPVRPERDLRNFRCAANPAPYKDRITGLANQETRGLVALWTREQFHNPLLIFAMDAAGLSKGLPKAGSRPVREDLWVRNEFPDIRPRMFAADIAALARPGARFDIQKAEPIGWYTTSYLGGPVALNTDNKDYVAVADAEFTPSSMLGIASDALLSETSLVDTRSTFKVIRAVAEEECWAYLDGINAFDAGYLSVGLFHWAASGAGANPTAPHELGGLVAYLRFYDEQSHRRASAVFTDNGLDTSAALDKKIADHVRTPNGEMKYPVPLGFTDHRGEVRPATSQEITEYLPSWRSFYRQVKAGRRDRDLTRAFYEMAKRRLRDIHKVRFPDDVSPTDSRTHPSTGRTIGSVFTSELMIALIMRWHVNQPSAIISGDAPSRHLRRIYEQAAASLPAEANGDAWEAALLAAFKIELHAYVVASGLKPDARDSDPDWKKYKLGFLLSQSDDIENPQWTQPRAKNPRQYRLDPQLRNLARTGNSFRLDRNIIEPK